MLFVINISSLLLRDHGYLFIRFQVFVAAVHHHVAFYQTLSDDQENISKHFSLSIIGRRALKYGRDG